MIRCCLSNGTGKLKVQVGNPGNRQFVMAYGACSIWRLLEGPKRGEYMVSSTEPPCRESVVATLPAAHRECVALVHQVSDVTA